MNEEREIKEYSEVLHKEIAELAIGSSTLLGLLTNTFNPALNEILETDISTEHKNRIIRSHRDFLQQFLDTHKQLEKVVRTSFAIQEDVLNPKN